MSIGGSKSAALNSAIAALTKTSVTVVVAVGNENVDANTPSLASAPSVITVGTIDTSTDAKASFSNFGASVDIFAPGVKVQSVGITSRNASIVSGTSIASLHVAGFVAYLIALEELSTTAAVTAKIKELARVSKAAMSRLSKGTTTLIAYNEDEL